MRELGAQGDCPGLLPLRAGVFRGDALLALAWPIEPRLLPAQLGGGAIGYEASRLARNNADWHRLLELCALFDTLIGDSDGIYNPRD